MKRSTMVTQMTEYWLGLFPSGAAVQSDLEEGLKEEVEDRMGRLLAFLEYHGMKPPMEKVDPVIWKTTLVWEDEDSL